MACGVLLKKLRMPGYKGLIFIAEEPVFAISIKARCLSETILVRSYLGDMNPEPKNTTAENR